MTTAEYEYMAERFRRDTGLMAPGKDAPPGLYTEDQDALRGVRWQEWLDGNAGLRARADYARTAVMP